MFLMMRKKETLACEQTPAVNKKLSCDGGHTSRGRHGWCDPHRKTHPPRKKEERGIGPFLLPTPRLPAPLNTWQITAEVAPTTIGVSWTTFCHTGTQCVK